MWHYLWPHLIYHSSYFLLRRKRLLVFTISLLGLLMIVPQLWVMNIYDYYIMYCPLPIYRLMLVSLLLSLFSLSFSIFFLARDNLPRVPRYLFHMFGLVDFCFETVFIYYTNRASVCVITAKEMYLICSALSICAVLSTAYFICLLPVWMCTKSTYEGQVPEKRDCTESFRHCIKCANTSPYIWPV